ncbi:DUF1947 domain-containing protein [Candidatus Woesearchaeota archaeon]|nr:DUF1947 domain-containing protein [Candidatus Woesearchaeota archaeon]
MRRHLRNQEIRDLIEKIDNLFNVDIIDKKDKVEIVDDKFILCNDKAVFFYREKKLIPTLKIILKNNFLNKITVDMGAVRFVAKGADIMRPGIVDADNAIEKNEIISIVDVNNKKPLAVGKALFSGQEINKMDKGKAIENIHYVGDEIWNL